MFYLLKLVLKRNIYSNFFVKKQLIPKAPTYVLPVLPSFMFQSVLKQGLASGIFFVTLIKDMTNAEHNCFQTKYL